MLNFMFDGEKVAPFYLYIYFYFFGNQKPTHPPLILHDNMSNKGVTKWTEVKSF